MLKLGNILGESNRFIQGHWLEVKAGFASSGFGVKVAALVLVLYVVLGFVLAIYWSAKPDTSELKPKVLEALGGDAGRVVTGAYTTVALIHVGDTLLSKPGGYITNDIAFPGVWMDNIPHWEYGVLIQMRDMAKAMREKFSRSQSQSVEDKDLTKAEAHFNFGNNNWLFPQTEKQYREGIRYIQRYLGRLTDSSNQNVQFFARADNLRYWLGNVETRLGSLSQRLSTSVGQRRLNTDLAGEENAKQATRSPVEFDLKTPWYEVDDVFYETRGSAWALIHFLKAIEVDFADVLEKKKARVSLQQIVRELEMTQQSVASPVILNGSGFGFLSNHSLVMASYISRANAAMIDLRELLEQG